MFRHMIFWCCLTLKRCASRLDLPIPTILLQLLFHRLEREDNHREYSRDQCDTSGADPGRDTDAGGNPKTGCGGQPCDLTHPAQLQYRAGAEKLDTR